MTNRIFNIDFSKRKVKIKPLTAINGAPLTGGAALKHNFSAEYLEMKPGYVRCKMPSGSYGYNQYICIHSIFPDFSLDESDEKSYNFAPTDRYLRSVKDAGCEIFLTLGEAAEPHGKILYAKAPENYEKWASVCEHILMHYNEGLWDGFKLNIKYVEIWDGADRRESFSGEPEQFFELYRVVANRLKERFPRVMIGGYGSLGFASLNRINASEEHRAAFDFMQNFFSYIRKEETKAPLDFFTWKCFTDNPTELALHAKYARIYLDGAGHKRTKSIVCEYNASEKNQTPPALREEYPAYLSASLIFAQKSPIDMLFYSTCEPGEFLNGLYTVDDGVTHRKYLAFEVLSAFSKMRLVGTSVDSGEDYSGELCALAAAGASEGMIILTSLKYSGRVELSISGAEYTVCSVKRLASGGERGEGRISLAEELKIAGNKICLSVNENEIFVISLF